MGPPPFAQQCEEADVCGRRGKGVSGGQTELSPQTPYAAKFFPPLSDFPRLIQVKALLKNTPAKKVKHLRSHIDRAEAERLVETYSDLILRLSYTYLKSTEDAKDICQTVFLRMLEKPRKFESPEHERAWIIRAAVNLCKDQLKSHWRRTTVDLEAARAVPAPEAEEGSLLAAVNLLPPKYRTVIYLYYYEGYSANEIAQLLGEKPATVATQLSRGREKLRTHLEQEGFA